MNKTGLVVTAHPGDFVWRAGGAIALHVKKGYRIKIACLSFGERGESARLWRKGEESGHVQKIKSIRLDCDEDAVLLEVEQVGGIACHTGRHSCFFQKLDGAAWAAVDPVLKDPGEIYKR